MKVRSLTVLAVAMMILAPFSARASDATAAAQGNLTMSHTISGRTVRCTRPGAVGFVVRGSTFVVTENIGPGTPAGAGTTTGDCVGFSTGTFTNAIPPTRQCGPSGAEFGWSTHTVSQSGSTYTIRSSYTHCNGTSESETFVVGLGATTLTYSHTFPVAGVTFTVSGTMSRIA